MCREFTLGKPLKKHKTESFLKFWSKNFRFYCENENYRQKFTLSANPKDSFGESDSLTIRHSRESRLEFGKGRNKANGHPRPINGMDDAITVIN